MATDTHATGRPQLPRRFSAVLVSLAVVGLILPVGCRQSQQPAAEPQAERSVEPETGHERMVGLLAKQKELSQTQSPLFGTADLGEREWALENMPLSVVDQFDAHYASGIAAKRLGLNQKAVDHLQAAFVLVPKLPPRVVQHSSTDCGKKFCCNWPAPACGWAKPQTACIARPAIAVSSRSPIKAFTRIKRAPNWP